MMSEYEVSDDALLNDSSSEDESNLCQDFNKIAINSKKPFFHSTRKNRKVIYDTDEEEEYEKSNDTNLKKEKHAIVIDVKSTSSESDADDFFYDCESSTSSSVEDSQDVDNSFSSSQQEDDDKENIETPKTKQNIQNNNLNSIKSRLRQPKKPVVYAEETLSCGSDSDAESSEESVENEYDRNDSFIATTDDSYFEDEEDNEKSDDDYSQRDEFPDSGIDLSSEDEKPSKSKKTDQVSNEMSTKLSKASRVSYAKAYFEEFRQALCTDIPHDVQITWNARLRKTAGLTYTRLVNGKRWARIELSEKVVDNLYRLKSTLLHEFCHVAAWYVDGQTKPPHGPYFKKWSSKASSQYPHHTVTTCHTYDIHYKYIYECETCLATFRRHSKSIDLEKQRCGRCHGIIALKGTCNKNGTMQTPRTPSKFSLYVSENYGTTRQKYGSHAETMKMLSARWKDEHKTHIIK